MGQKPVVGATTAITILAAFPQIAQAQSAQATANAEPIKKDSTSSFRISVGANYSSGDYGDIEDTKVYSIPVALSYRTGKFRFRVSAPYVWINGPGSLLQTPEGRDGGLSGGSDGGGSDNSGSGSSNSGSGSSNSGSGSSGGSEIEVEDEDDGEVIDDDGATGGGGVTLADRHRNGFGDVNVAATYSVDLGHQFYLEPSVRVKLPTASRSKRLGTGEFDLTVSGDLIKDVGPASFYVNGRRKFAGKPEGSTIRSTWGLGAGASVRAARGLVVGAGYDWQQSAFSGRKASSELTGWGSVRLNDRASVTLFGTTGFTVNSVDFAAGTSISVRL